MCTEGHPLTSILIFIDQDLVLIEEILDTDNHEPTEKSHVRRKDSPTPNVIWEL